MPHTETTRWNTQSRAEHHGRTPYCRSLWGAWFIRYCPKKFLEAATFGFVPPLWAQQLASRLHLFSGCNVHLPPVTRQMHWIDAEPRNELDACKSDSFHIPGSLTDTTKLLRWASTDALKNRSSMRLAPMAHRPLSHQHLRAVAS
jgi:hypothetical protein